MRRAAARRDELLRHLRPADAAGGRGLSAAEPGRDQPGTLAGLCPRCRAPFDSEQEYCLECGLRLPWESPVFARLTAHTAKRTPFLPLEWTWPAALALVVAAGGAALAIFVTRDDGSQPIPVATGGNRPAETVTAAKPATSGTTTKAATPTTPAKTAGLIRWPRGRTGWTIVLGSLPQADGGAPARAKATEALDRGLRQVGVIDSSRFASLHPGYYVVFQGVYDDEAEASSALQRARAVFPSAYQREIVP